MVDVLGAAAVVSAAAVVVDEAETSTAASVERMGDVSVLVEVDAGSIDGVLVVDTILVKAVPDVPILIGLFRLRLTMVRSRSCISNRSCWILFSSSTGFGKSDSNDQMLGGLLLSCVCRNDSDDTPANVIDDDDDVVTFAVVGGKGEAVADGDNDVDSVDCCIVVATILLLLMLSPPP
jgi:hypothetical protein